MLATSLRSYTTRLPAYVYNVTISNEGIAKQQLIYVPKLDKTFVKADSGYSLAQKELDRSPKLQALRQGVHKWEGYVGYEHWSISLQEVRQISKKHFSKIEQAQKVQDDYHQKIQDSKKEELKAFEQVFKERT